MFTRSKGLALFLALVVLLSMVTLVGCDDSDSDTLTPPPATVISASESPTAGGAPQSATSAAPQQGQQPAPTPTQENYPAPVATTPTPWVYPTK